MGSISLRKVATGTCALGGAASLLLGGLGFIIAGYVLLGFMIVGFYRYIKAVF